MYRGVQSNAKYGARCAMGKVGGVVFHHLVTILVFKLLIFIVVKTEKFCLEQNNVWYAVVPTCLDTVSTARNLVN